jgi:hypothetical protein
MFAVHFVFALMLAGYAYSGSAEDSYKQLYPNLSYKLSLL